MSFRRTSSWYTIYWLRILIQGTVAEVYCCSDFFKVLLQFHKLTTHVPTLFYVSVLDYSLDIFPTLVADCTLLGNGNIFE